ncbi:hypothetical protein AA12467_2311 [Gluconobacter sphaericus NBRC 12467]|nr:hypothetical protein AA12467_2311 [Gluconobacter sphaericus NBRC 12467]
MSRSIFVGVIDRSHREVASVWRKPERFRAWCDRYRTEQVQYSVFQSHQMHRRTCRVLISYGEEARFGDVHCIGGTAQVEAFFFYCETVPDPVEEGKLMKAAQHDDRMLPIRQEED